MTRKNKMQARRKRDSEKEKKMKIQNSKPKIKNLNTKRCTRSTSLVMMDTDMERAKKKASHFEREMCFKGEVGKKKGRRQKGKNGHQK
jgi:hypothetical protein